MSRIRNNFFLFIAFEGFFSESAGLDDKSHLGVYSQVSLSNKLREARSAKAFKSVYLCLCSSIYPPYPFQRTKLLQKIHIRKRARSFLLFFCISRLLKFAYFKKKHYLCAVFGNTR